MPGYAAARGQVADLLDAARYACNRALHQLTVLPRPTGGSSFPITFPLAFNEMAGYQWAHERDLPDPTDEHDDKQRVLRATYVTIRAGRDMADALDRLRRWFERVLT